MIKAFGKLLEFNKDYNLDQISLETKLILARHTAFVNMNMDFIYDYSIKDALNIFNVWNNKRIKIIHRLENDYYHNFIDNDINLEDKTLLKIAQHKSSLVHAGQFQYPKKLSLCSNFKYNFSLTNRIN
jgi:hypothetical protein